jgi:flagellar protein FlaG
MEVPAVAGPTAPAVATAVASTATQGAQAVPARQAAPPAQPTLGQVTEAVNAINRSMATQSRGLEFSVDADSQRTVVKVIDSQTGELIRQIPTVETLEIAHALDQAQGLLIRQQA